MGNVKDFFGFTSAPFTKDVGPKDLFRYSQMDQLFARLQATAEDGSALLVTGRAGTGKTTSVRGFLGTLPARYRVIYLGQFQRGSALFCKLGLELGIRANMFGAKRMVSLTQRLKEESGSGRQLVLVIDEAHLLERNTLEDIRLLTNQDMDKRSPMSLIMLGQHWLRDMLRKQGHEALYQRLRLRYALEGLTESETKAYLEHHLKLAGGKLAFSDEAISQIFVASEGILREINNIAYESLLHAASLGKHQVNEEIVAWVIDQREMS
jgi:type II secretory pathway predicted ATPase ExeA